MTTLIASVVLVCTPVPGAARESVPSLQLGKVATAIQRDLHSLQGRLVEGVETVLKGVTLFDGSAESPARRSTFAVRPDIGSKGPVAMFDLRF
jgi:hypothetical protein